MILTAEQIANFPVRHLSVSAIRQYMSDPQMFLKRYIRLEFDAKKSPALIEGDLLHRLLEAHWESLKNDGTYSVDQVLAQGREEIKMDDEKGLIDWGKTGNLEKSIKTVIDAFEFYVTEKKDKYKKILGVEEAFFSLFSSLDGEDEPIPLKGFIDLIVEDDAGDLVLIDHKLVTTPVLQDEVSPAYELQAGAYFFLLRYGWGRDPKKIIFDQVKKTKNRDGTPQLTPYVIEYTPELLERFIVIYERIVRQLAGYPLISEDGIMEFIPNPFGMFGGEESWADFCFEVREQQPQILAEIKAKNKDSVAIPDIDL